MKFIRYISGIAIFYGAFLTTLIPHAAWAGAAGGVGEPTQFTGKNISTIMEKIILSVQGVPGLISAAAYIAGLIMTVWAAIKLRKHFDNPNDTPFNEVMARVIIGGCLFAFPTIMVTLTAMFGLQTSDAGPRNLTLEGTGNLGGILSGGLSNLLGAGVCDVNRGINAVNTGLGNIASGGGLLGGAIGAAGSLVSGGTLGQIVCYASHAFGAASGFLASALYIAGLFLVFWGLLQMRDHIIDPMKMPVNQPLKKLLVAGMFFAFPAIIDAVQFTVNGGKSLLAIDPFINARNCGAGATGGVMGIVSSGASIIGTLSGGGSVGGLGSFGGQGGAGGILDSLGGGGASAAGAASRSGGLDCMMVRFVSDLWGPMHMAIGIFCYIAGLILIALAVRRILDNMDKGLKSPVGMGTISMILIGGLLLTFDKFIGALTVSLVPDMFGLNRYQLHGSLAYTQGICGGGESSCGGVEAVNRVITTVFAFSFIIGTISILRGLFMLKEVANGGNASLMASFTHILAGGLAVNLGPVVEAVQNSFGLQGMGIRVGTGFGAAASGIRSLFGS